FDFELHLAADVRQVSQMLGKNDSDHLRARLSVSCLLTFSTFSSRLSFRGDLSPRNLLFLRGIKAESSPAEAGFGMTRWKEVFIFSSVTSLPMHRLTSASAPPHSAPPADPAQSHSSYLPRRRRRIPGRLSCRNKFRIYLMSPRPSHR